MSEDLSHKIVRIEAIVESHEKIIGELKQQLAIINDHYNSLNNEIIRLNERISMIEDNIKESNRKSMWYVGTALTIINLIISIVFHFLK